MTVAEKLSREELVELRILIAEITEAFAKLYSLAPRPKINLNELRRAWHNLEKYTGDMSPYSAKSYRNVIFGARIDKYISNSDREEKLNSISVTHIEIVLNLISEFDIDAYSPVPKQEDRKSWRPILGQALKSVRAKIKFLENETNRQKYTASPDFWFSKPSFDSDQVLIRLQGPFSADLKRGCGLDLSQNREALIKRVVGALSKNFEMTSVAHTLRVMTFFRTYFPFELNEELWIGARDAIKNSARDQYLVSLERTTSFRDLRILDGQKLIRTYEYYEEMAKKFDHNKDYYGYSDAIIKQAHFLTSLRKYDEARNLLLPNVEKFEKSSSCPNDFAPLYGPEPKLLKADMLIALSRVELGYAIDAEQKNFTLPFQYLISAQETIVKNFGINPMDFVPDIINAQAFHCLGNIQEDLAVLYFIAGDKKRADLHKAEAIKLFELYGDEDRAKISRHILSNSRIKSTGRINLRVE